MRANLPIIKTASDTPGPTRFPLSDILSEDSLYNLNLAMKRAAKRELKLNQVILIESPAEIVKIMERNSDFKGG